MSTTPTAATSTPEQRAYAIVQPLTVDCIRRRDALMTRIVTAIRDHSEAQQAEIDRLRVMADEPTTKRVWDGIQAMAGLFADPDHMPTVLEFKAAFDAAFSINGKPYNVERIKAEWQDDYAAMEARATAAEDALAAMTKERDDLRARDHSWAATFSRLDAEANEDAQKLAASLERERLLTEKAEAFDTLTAKVSGFPFSRRQAFFPVLQRIVSEAAGIQGGLAAWPDAICLAKPEHIAKAYARVAAMSRDEIAAALQQQETADGKVGEL